jgi:hypothetical protein
VQFPNQLAGLPLTEGDARRLAPQVTDWRVRAARLDRWVRANVAETTPGITTVTHTLTERTS